MRIRFCVVIFAAMMIAGCGPVMVPPAPGTESPSQSAPAKPAPATQPAEAAPPPDLLAQKAQSYAESVQKLLNAHRPTTQATIQPTTPPTPVPQAVAPAPVTQPVVAKSALKPAPVQPHLQPVPAPQPPAVQVAINPPAQPSSPTTSPAVSSTVTAKATLTHKIDQLGHDQPTDPAAQLNQQLLEFLRGNSVPEAGALAQLPAQDRQTLSILLDGLSNYRDVLRNSPTATNSQKMQPLLSMADRLNSEADLSAPVMALCTAVNGFGNYDPIDVNNLHAESVTPAIVYCQVTHFVSQLNGQSQWETRLTERLALYSEADGKMVWSEPAKTIVDQCKNQRHDFYCFRRIDLPALPAGQYLLKATLEDQISNKVAEATLAMTVK